MPKPRDSGELEREATFVFRGTVRKLRASTIPSLPLTTETAIVMVDEILRGPDAFSAYAEQEITIQSDDPLGLEKGQRAIFHTSSVIVGQSLAVRVLRWEPDISQRRGREEHSWDDSAADLREQVVKADLVVIGRVLSVSEPEVARARGRKHLAPPISEHDPLWHEAIVEVGEVAKGRAPRRQIVIRFPQSSDVRWYDSPKLEPGQEGIFLLQRTASPGGRQIYTVRGAGAFQPLAARARIESLVKRAR
jgi:hypothetical protein